MCTEIAVFICAFGLVEFLRMPFPRSRQWLMISRPSHRAGSKKLSRSLGFFGYYREFLPHFSRLTADMNSMKAKSKWNKGEWASIMAGQFQEIKDLFCLEGGPCQAFPMTFAR